MLKVVLRRRGAAALEDVLRRGLAPLLQVGLNPRNCHHERPRLLPLRLARARCRSARPGGEGTPEDLKMAAAQTHDRSWTRLRDATGREHQGEQERRSKRGDRESEKD